VTLRDSRIEAVESVLNAKHTDCSSPVETLAEHGVGLMLVAGMGMRTYLGFRQHAIDVNCSVAGTVADAVESYLRNETITVTEETLCGCHGAGPHDHLH
jgi:predicted Fe-Mo cluster-binding NifX family protein